MMPPRGKQRIVRMREIRREREATPGRVRLKAMVDEVKDELNKRECQRALSSHMSFWHQDNPNMTIEEFNDHKQFIGETMRMDQESIDNVIFRPRQNPYKPPESSLFESLFGFKLW